METTKIILIEQLFKDYNKKIYNIVKKITQNEEMAKDIVQDTFLTAFEKIHQLKKIESADKWLIMIAVNKAKRKYNNNKREISIDEDYILEQEESDEIYIPESNYELRELKNNIQKIINLLPFEYRQVIVLYFFGNFSYSEISKTLEISEGTVKSRLFRAKKILAKSLSNN